ncbi:hypothetical protein P8C59_009439 [Phyllachora maydis]|uniref:Uncharacterized protein n=1 Tax=Phyllachora maydis TaxID=1825666 RepID=A0AAD9MGB4_9PEZI|nr:hypothetical protein P8C59_009439 [Phyllachora maydis]
MAFLFKNKKNQDRVLASREGLPGSTSTVGSAAARVVRDEKGSLQRSTPTASLNSLDNDGSVGSPDPYVRRRGESVDKVAQQLPQQPMQQTQSQPQPPSQPSDLPFRNANPAMQSPPTNPNASLYPWSQRRLTYTSSHPSPFPRYGAAVNSISSKEGDIYVMGGLINSSTVKGDLWMIEAGGNMACYPLSTTAEGPGPRVGHSSLLVGNAFIVYGGDTKIEETDVLDETLYLLNTSTRQWSRALPAGPRPSGRYGHSLNILGSKIYIFGGQVEGYFMNDLAAYDLNQLQMPNNRWEMLQSNSDTASAQQGLIPPARTNHSMITFNDKMYLFGGTNGFQWFNDLDSDKDGDDRVGHMSRKLATALHTQKESQNQVERLKDEIEAERRARKLADDTTNAAQKRMEDLEGYKQQTSLELERLKADLHDAQREARAKAIEATEAVAALQLIKVETKEFENMYKDAVGSSKDHSNTIGSLRTAVAASAETKLLLERQLEEERAHREMVETKLSKLKAEHEARTAELVAAQQRLRDAEEMVEKHANEARTHREAVLAGLDKITARDMPAAQKDQSDRIVALRGQLSAANALARKYQQEADTASERLRSAEERIAGLEAYQEQASREGVSIRRQLQSALRETQSLQAANSEIRQQLESQQLEANAITVQHNTLKDILSERGISPTSAGRVRGLSSPQNSSPELARLRDLEQQLAATAAAHEETKNTAATQAQEAEFAYREKLAQLENDYQSAVHYVKGLEKSLKQLKEQLTRYKADNSQLKEQIVELEDQLRDGEAPEKHAPEDWEEQRQALEAQVQQSQTEMKTSAAELEKQLQALRQELSNATKERQTAVHDIQAANQRLDSTKKDIEQLQQENALLERRALDAEAKVGSLLDQVEISVDNYRRRSRQVPSTGSDHGGGGGSSSGGGSHGASVPPNGISHARQESSEIGSVYGSLSEARNSGALDSLANELDMLRSQWEATSKNYRLSNNFEFEGQRGNHGSPSAEKKSESVSLGLSGSLADWRKRLDETHPEGSQPAK